LADFKRDEKKEDPDKVKSAWEKSAAPQFCWNNQIRTPDACPPEYPERAGQLCFKSCKNEEVPYVGELTRVV